MVRQISAADTNVSAAGQTPGAAQNTDQFRSILKAAVGQSESEQDENDSAGKTDAQKQASVDRSGGGRKKERAKKTDRPDQDGTGAGRTRQSLLSPEISISPDAAVFASVKGRPVFLGQGQPASVTECGDSGLNSAGAVQAAEGIQTGEKSSGAEKEQSGATIQAFPFEGEAGRISGKGTAAPETADETTPDRPVRNSGIPVRQAADPTDLGRREFRSPDFSRQVGSTAPGSDVRGAQMLPAEQKNGRTANAEGKISSVDSDAADGTQLLQKMTGTVRVHPPDDKDSGAADGAAAENGGLPALYGDGKVVIKVSGEPKQASPSPARQVADTVMHQVRNGKTEFQMDLYPKSLGKVSVKLTSQDGLLTVEIAAADPKTQNLLLSGSSEIRSILQASTGQNVQTVTPDQQAAQWYGQQSSGGGGASGNRRQKRDEPRRDKLNGIESVNAELNTGDFLSMIQRIGAYAR